MDDGSVFEIGKYYKHSSGHKMAIRGEIDTYFHGTCLIGEDDEACFIPVSGNDAAATVNWYEISKEEWETPRDRVTDVIPDILNSQTSYRTRAEHLLSVLIHLGASKAATDMVQSLSEGYGFDPLYGKREADSPEEEKPAAWSSSLFSASEIEVGDHVGGYEVAAIELESDMGGRLTAILLTDRGSRMTVFFDPNDKVPLEKSR